MMGLTPTTSQILAQLKAALAALTNKSFHYVAAPNTIPPYIVWAEDGDNDLTADDSHAERAIQGAVDLYTKTEEDPLRDAIPRYLRALGRRTTSTPSNTRQRQACCILNGFLR